MEVPNVSRRLGLASDCPACVGSSYHVLSCLPRLSSRSFSRMSTDRFPSTSWAEMKFVMTRVGIPRQRSTAEDTPVTDLEHQNYRS